MIEIGKTYRTRCGWPARVHANDLGDDRPVLASVKNPKYGWLDIRLTAEGRRDFLGQDNDLDLIEVKPVITLTRWVNVYRDATQPDGYWLAWHPTEGGQSIQILMKAQ